MKSGLHSFIQTCTINLYLDHKIHRKTHFSNNKQSIFLYFYLTSQSGNVPNPEFAPLEETLNEIKLPRSQVVRNVGVGQILTNALINTKEYYSYPGSYIELPTLRQYLSATIIQIPPAYEPSISIPQVSEEDFWQYSKLKIEYRKNNKILGPQFSAFTSILNTFGQPTTNVLSLVPQGNRPVVQAVGYNVVTL